VQDREIDDFFFSTSIIILGAVAGKIDPGKEETVQISGMAGLDTALLRRRL
jgi:hypothetical protein